MVHFYASERIAVILSGCLNLDPAIAGHIEETSGLDISQMKLERW